MLLYRIIISIYFWALKIAAFFSPKAKLWVQGRKNIQPYIQQNIGNEPLVWFHCPSLGEFEQGRPLIEKIREDFPEIKLLLTFFSPSGYEIRKNYSEVDYVCYLPKDKPKAIADFLTIVKPKMVIFVKYDYWFLLLKALIKRQIPVYFVSTVIKKKHYLTKWYARPFRKILKQVNHFYVQDDFSRKQFEQMGIHRVTVAGDTRVDRVAKLAQNVKRYPAIEEWTQAHRILICGSTWQNDEEVIIPAFENMIASGWRMIIAPHDVSSKNLIRLRQNIKNTSVAFSDILSKNGHRHDFAQADILIVDTIGHLNSLYQFGTVCYIGGGFNKSGIHNTLEPATFGLPLIFGPNYSKFREARTFVEEKGAYTVGQWSNGQSTQGLALCRDQFKDLIAQYDDEKLLMEAGKVTKRYIHLNTGAANRILGALYSNL